MKLNPDCIRQILLAVENQTAFEKPTRAYDVAEECDFPLEEILYHINQCELYGFFTEVRHYVNGDYNCMIMDLSPKGHEFIADAHSDSVWKKVLQTISPVKGVSISVLTEVIKAVVRSKLNL